MNEIKHTNIKTGLYVKIVMKEDQWTGKIPEAPTRNKGTVCPKCFFGETVEIGSVKEIPG